MSNHYTIVLSFDIDEGYQGPVIKKLMFQAAEVVAAGLQVTVNAELVVRMYPPTSHPAATMAERREM
jgi:2-keto-4-pentenoate hydratase